VRGCTACSCQTRFGRPLRGPPKKSRPAVSKVGFRDIPSGTILHFFNQNLFLRLALFFLTFTVVGWCQPQSRAHRPCEVQSPDTSRKSHHRWFHCPNRGNATANRFITAIHLPITLLSQTIDGVLSTDSMKHQPRPTTSLHSVKSSETRSITSDCQLLSADLHPPAAVALHTRAQDAGASHRIRPISTRQARHASHGRQWRC
jgi:hypothetical protein